MDKNYILIVKTGQAEIRAIENTSTNTLNQLFPVIELTRGRKKTLDDKKEVFPFTSRLERLKKVLRGMSVAIDATSDEALSCPEVDELYEYGNGYERWVNLVCDLEQEGCFSCITPALLMNFGDPNFDENLKKEIESLSEHFDTLIYRNSIEDDYCYTDLPFILEHLPQNKQLLILIDCSYSPQAMENNVSQKLLKRIENLKKIIDYRCFLSFCATSFPNNIGDIGGEDYDEFRLSEVSMHNKIRSVHPDVVYGDYGSINPKRNDNILMARGWIPRIDVPLFEKIYYYRQRRAGRAYDTTYKEVAKKTVRDSKYPGDITCWGCNQINNCCTLPPSSSPNYWISVRMNIHIEQQVRRLKGINAR